MAVCSPSETPSSSAPVRKWSVVRRTGPVRSTGYWLLTSTGTLVALAPAGCRSPRPAQVVGVAALPGGNGGWVASDGAPSVADDRYVGPGPAVARLRIGHGPRRVLWIGGTHGNEREGSVATANLQTRDIDHHTPSPDVRGVSPYGPTFCIATGGQNKALENGTTWLSPEPHAGRRARRRFLRERQQPASTSAATTIPAARDTLIERTS